MECKVRISSDTGVFTPDSLVRSALSEHPLDLNIVNESGNSIAIHFYPNRDTVDSVLDGSPSTSSLVSHCHLHGLYQGFLSALSLCDSNEINGLIVTPENFFILSVRNGQFILLPQTKQSCEFGTRFKRAAPNAPRIPSYYSEYNDGKVRYVELALVADYSMYEKYGKDEKKVNDRLHSIANIVNSLYHPLNVKITLVYTEVWKDGDKFSVATSGDKTLERFMAYRKTMLKEHPNDNAHLITNEKFEQGVVGKAFKGTMCSYDYSGGVDVDHNNSSASVAATVAHEMGHNFGMEHDAEYGSSCACPSGHCIMAAVTGNPPPALWSDCSLRYLTRGFGRGMDFCLKNQPEKTVGEAKCGNGIVETGEECDSGENAFNKCCDAKTCKFIGDAECADGECCDLEICKPKARAIECRPASGLCDLAEYCNGETPECPADFFVQDGHVCPGREDEYCYQGQCGSRNDQCEAIWGTGSKSAIPQCFNQNTQGIIQGNCGFDVHQQKYTGCDPKDVMCGRLHCETQAERPIFGDPSTVQSAYSYIRFNNEKIHQCNVIKTTFVGTKKRLDPGMVNDGAKCGNDKICVDARCQERKEVNKTVSQCNDNCHWRGICNNVGNCHCANGFGGVACEIPGYGGSVNSNTANLHRGMTPSLAFLILFGMFGVAFIVACIYYRIKQKRNIPREMWTYARKSLKLQGVLVPVRKAPAPPGGRRPKRESFTAMWGDAQVSYSATARQPALQTPVIPLMSAGATSPIDTKVITIKPNLSRVPSARPKEPPPTVPSRPHPLALQRIYDEQFTDLGPAEKPLPPTPPDDPYPADHPKRSENTRPVNPPPPPPPKDTKPTKGGSVPPPIPKEGPRLQEGKLDVRKMAALFDAKRKAGT